MTDARRARLHAIAAAYVTEGLAKGNFDAIPYADNVALRAPLCPGGSAVPLQGKENLRNVWWAPLPKLVSGVTLVGTQVNADETAATAELLCEIKELKTTLRIIDRFKIDASYKIVEQENFFDPRDVTNAGWRKEFVEQREKQLHAIGRAYVTDGLGKGNFDVIPYRDDVTLRAPLCPGGVWAPLVGKETLRTVWWAPLPGLVGKTEVIDSFVSDDLTTVSVHFLCGIKLDPPVTLRITDRFRVDFSGRIYEQENFFDPRDVTNPGWNKA